MWLTRWDELEAAVVTPCLISTRGQDDLSKALQFYNIRIYSSSTVNTGLHCVILTDIVAVLPV